MSFSADFSHDTPDPHAPIPAGTPLYVEMTYAPGGADLPGWPKEGALTRSRPPSDALYLKAEFTVLRGPYKGRKFWSNLTVAGGKLDEKGQSIAAGITRKTIRNILDSAQNLKSSDESAEAAAKRILTGFRMLQGRRFVCRARIEPGQDGYPDKNVLGQVLSKDMRGYPATAEALDNPGVAASVSAPLPPAWKDERAAAAPAPAIPSAWAASTDAPVWEVGIE